MLDSRPRLFRLLNESCFIFGPRGTGKSTLLKQHYKENALFIDLLKPHIWRQYQAHPEHLYAVVEGSNLSHVIIDEVQRLPELLNVVHDLIEQKRGLTFILTGSSCRKLKRAGVNLLAGRVLETHLHPFMASELNDDFCLRDALNFGLLPLVYNSQHKGKTLKTYVSLYLREEVQAEGLVRNIGDFSRFLEVIAFSHGSQLNYSNVARECQVSRKLIEGYVDVLKDLLLAIVLPVFTYRAKRQTIAQPKFYYFDAGVYRSLRSTGPLDVASEINGPGLEGLVLQHLRAWNDYSGEPCKLYYWRTRHGVEVDFVLYGDGGFYAIEVKHSDKVHHKDLIGLKSFCEDYPEATPILLYTGTDRLKIQDIFCLPVSDFLKSLKPNQVLLKEKYTQPD